MTEKKYKVIVSERAKRMLGTHVQFLAKVNKAAAAAKKKELMEAMHSLEHMPQRYPFYEDEVIPKGRYRRMFVANWYLVLYQVLEDTVFVESILDCRKDYS